MQNTTNILQSELDLLRQENKMLHNEISILRKSLSFFCGIDVNDDNQNSITPEIVLLEACKMMKVSIDDTISRTKKSEHTIARTLFMTYCNKYNFGSTTIIGKHINRNHATVIHGLKRIENDKTFKKKYIEFENKINNTYATIPA